MLPSASSAGKAQGRHRTWHQNHTRSDGNWQIPETILWKQSRLFCQRILESSPKKFIINVIMSKSIL